MSHIIENFDTASSLAVCSSVLERTSVIATFNYGCEAIVKSLTLHGTFVTQSYLLALPPLYFW